MGVGELIVGARRHWVALATFTMLGVVAAAVLAVLSPRSYSATSEVYVVTNTGDSASELAQGSDYSQKQVRSFSALATRPVVLDPVIQTLGLKASSKNLAEHITARSPLNTNLISITASSHSATEARNVANATANSLGTVVATIVPAPRNGNPSLGLKVVTEAELPSAPSSPTVAVWLVVGAAMGAATGAAWTALRGVLNTKVRTAEEAERLSGAPVIGVVTADADGAGMPGVGLDGMLGARRESFRQIRTNLQFLNAQAPHKVVVVTSSIPAEGKSTTSVNLAVSLAAAGSSVCLVDADLRRPAIADYLGLQQSVGLSTVLIHQAEIGDVLQPWGSDQVMVVTSGERPPNPTELLSSERCGAVLRTLAARFDVVVVDTPPLAPAVDAAVLAHSAGGAVLVVGAGQVDRDDLQRSVAALGAAQARVLGVIVNRAPAKNVSRYAYAYEVPPNRGRALVRSKRGWRPSASGDAPPPTAGGTAGDGVGSPSSSPSPSASSAKLRDASRR